MLSGSVTPLASTAMKADEPTLTIRMLAGEFLGSALLALVVVGSGATAQRLSPRDLGLELLENAAATGLGLYVLILIFRSVSGAHFNPIVSIADWLIGEANWRRSLSYVPLQIAGCISGAVLADALFSLPVGHFSIHSRLSSAHFASEIVATAGLLIVIFALARTGSREAVPAAVGCYIAGAYFFTSSTSFANPAITIGRIFTTSFAGIAPDSVIGFIGAQLLGGAIGVLVVIVLYPRPPMAFENGT